MERRHVTGKGPVSSSPSRKGRPNYERARYLNHDLDGPSNFENLEHCRAELLQKLDELKDHLSRSCEVAAEKPPAKRMGAGITARNDPYFINHATHVQEGLSSSHGVYRQAPVVPYANRSSLRDLIFHRGHPHEFTSYADNYQHQMYMGPYDHQPQYLHRPYHHGYYGNVNHDMFVPSREPTCSCVHCFDRNWDLPFNHHSGVYSHTPSDPNYIHHPLPIGHGPQGFGKSHTCSLNSTELDIEHDGIHPNYPRKTDEAYRDPRILHPVAGGAPLIACTNCFELLKLPKKHISVEKIQHKLQCGACSSIILFELGNKALALPVSANFDSGVTEMDGFSCNTAVENVSYQQSASNLCSDSNADSLPKVSLADNKLNSDVFEKQLDPLSPASSHSEKQQPPKSLTPEIHGSSSSVEELESVPHPVLATEDCRDHCSTDIIVSKAVNEEKGTKSEFDHNASWQNCVGDSAVSTEIDMSSKEFAKTFTSQDSVDEIKERDKKGAQSSSVENSSADLVKSAENVEFGTSQVFVNGHLIPEHLVQKAELLAGPIQPGDYWYDIVAGFWGVMGYPCLGIIMPNIEEFNYPMPVDCAAGNTGVFVNGRELHEKDLDLLAGRGLPETGQRCYLVEISGRVVDEETGEELDNIGKLAPTVERAKHGFGMKVPRFIVRRQGDSLF